MADNMIKLIAKLNVEESIPIINKQIERMQNKINPIKIDVKVDDTIKQLRTQLEALAQMPKSNALTVATEQAQSLGNQAKKTKQEVESLKRELSSGSKAMSIGDSGIPKYLDLVGSTEQRKLDAKTLLGDSLNNVDAQVSRVSIATENAKGILKDFQVQVEKQDGSLEILTYKLIKAGGAYEYMGKKIREATNATTFRKTPIDVQVDLQQGKLDAFISDLKKAGVEAQELGVDVEGLRGKLNNVGTDANRMSEFLNAMDVARSKLAAYNSELQSQKAIQRFNSGLQTAQNKLTSFEQTYKRAINSTKTMKTLSGETTTFAKAFDEMRNRVVKSDTELKKLNADMRNFEQQATNTGLKGASAFDKFGKSFKLISTYISANRIISAVVSELREAVSELQNVDNILTEISKTSEISGEGLKELGANSFDVASKYGRLASDYLLGVQEFSRAGYAEDTAKAMAELSLKAQAAGDMTAELSNEYIIATGAAYDLADNEKALNDVLDRQNYITNRNPINMEKLATATKLVASQAASAGVGIDEMTAAVGTMSSVTQQSGEVAARAFRGIIMNLQQTKATAEDIGDGGEAITAESLTKYEKATKELGVSLKAVKNGTMQLRQPMETLRDLSVAVSKESENSIKVANLVSAVGGKYRGNQLLALLRNFEMYDKMLAEYNSDSAINSAMEEATKSANNWSGSMNKLKNSWTQLVNQVINSDEAVAVINALNSGIQSLTQSSTIQGVKYLTKSFFDFTKTLSDFKSSFGDSAIGGFIQKWIMPEGFDLLDSFRGFKIAGNLVSQNKEKQEAREEASRIAKEARQAYLDTLNATEEDSSLGDIISKYASLNSAIDDSESARENLVSVQEQLVNKYGEEKNGIDLVNKSLEENIKLIAQQEQTKNINFVKDNEQVINEAKKTFGISNIDDKATETHKAVSIIDNENIESKAFTNSVKDYIQKKYKDVWKNINQIGTASFEVKADISIEEQLKAINTLVEAYEYAAKVRQGIMRKNDTDAIMSSMHDWQQKIIDSYNIIIDAQQRVENDKSWDKFNQSADSKKYLRLLNKASDYNSQLNDSTLDVATRYEASLKLDNVINKLQDIGEKYPVVNEIIESSLAGLGLAFDSTTDNILNAKEIWLESLDEVQKGTLSSVDKTISAMTKLASGEALDSKSAWEIINLDDTGIISDIQLDKNGEYILSLEQIVKLKDTILQQEIETREANIANAEAQKQTIEDKLALEEKHLANLSAAQAPNSMAKHTENLQEDIDKTLVKIQTYKETLEGLGYSIKNESLLTEELRKRMGDLSGTSGMLEAKSKALQKSLNSLKDSLSQLKDEVSAIRAEADARVKAYEYSIDNVVKGLENEVENMEKGKEELEEQLNLLEEQKSELEEIVDNYKTAGSAVEDAIKKQIDGIKKEREEIENGYDARIKKLKEENEEREDALEYEKKLANLANAEKNKVNTFSQETGWTYETDKIAVKKAQDELNKYKADKEIKDLEKEKESKLKTFDEQIEGFEKYSEEWSEIIKSIENAENERIATEILGSNWREDIKKKDTDIINKFKNNYQSYTTKLKTLTDNEIANLNKSIEAKNKEIEAKKKQISIWQDYKNQMKEAVDVIDGKLSDYMQYLDDVKLSENSTNEARLNTLETFKTKYASLIDSIAAKNGQIDETSQKITAITDALNELNEKQVGIDLSDNTPSVLGGLSGAIPTGSIFEVILQALTEAFKQLSNSIPHFAKGGGADFTGFAWMDGTPNSTETIFTAAQSKKLYNYVDAMPEVSKLYNANVNGLRGNSENNTNVTVKQMTVVANTPQEFATQFRSQMSEYLKTELTKSQIY